METLLQVGLSNAAVAAVMALVLLPAARLLRKPALTHALCLLILVKLVTPPVWHVPVEWVTRPAPAVKLPDPWPRSEPPELPPSAPSWEPSEARISASPDAFTVPSPLVNRSATLATADETAAGPTLARVAPAAALVAPVAPVAPVARVSEEASIEWRALLPWAWLAGSILCFGSVVLRVRLLRRLLRFAEPAPPDVQRRARALAGRFRLRAAPGVWLAPGSVCPMLVGLPLRARLYVSAGLWARLADRQRDALLLHELAHYRRRDHWVRPLEMLVTTLYWWHPAVWLTRRALRDAEEQCCDAWVLFGMPGAARDYAAALLDVVDFASSSRRAAALPVFASGMGEFRQLKRRLTMIQRSSIPRTLTWTGVAVVCVLGALLLPLGPMAAQPQESTASDASASGQYGRSANDGATTGRAAESAPDNTDGAEAAEAPRIRPPAKPEDKEGFRLHAQLVGAQLQLRNAEQQTKRLETEAAERRELQRRFDTADFAGGGERVVEVFSLRRAKADETERMFREFARMAEVTVNADLRTNALVLEGTRGRIDILKEEVGRYDAALGGAAAPERPQPPQRTEPVRPVDQARQLSLLDVGRVKDGAGTRGRAVRFTGKDGDVVVTPGDAVLVELPKPATELEWSAGDRLEKVGTTPDGPAFDYVMCTWDADGKLTWTLYSSPRLAGPEDSNRRAEAQLAAIEARLAELGALRRQAAGDPPRADGKAPEAGAAAAVAHRTEGEGVVLTTRIGRIEATDAGGGRKLWTSEIEGAPLFPPTVWKGRVYVGAAGGKLLVFDLRTGERFASTEVPPGGR